MKIDGASIIWATLAAITIVATSSMFIISLYRASKQLKEISRLHYNQKQVKLYKVKLVKANKKFSVFVVGVLHYYKYNSERSDTEKFKQKLS